MAVENKTIRTEAHRVAEKKYNKKRLKKPAIPAIRLENEEKTWTDEVFEKFGKSKKEAVLKGLELLKDSLNKA
jgi:hypothetical protein